MVRASILQTNLVRSNRFLFTPLLLFFLRLRTNSFSPSSWQHGFHIPQHGVAARSSTAFVEAFLLLSSTQAVRLKIIHISGFASALFASTTPHTSQCGQAPAFIRGSVDRSSGHNGIFDFTSHSRSSTTGWEKVVLSGNVFQRSRMVVTGISNVGLWHRRVGRIDKTD